MEPISVQIMTKVSGLLKKVIVLFFNVQQLHSLLCYISGLISFSE
jgi:hypothetical protein